MPNWKKVITSGSSATLTSVIATTGFTGSLSGSATSAISSSYALTASFSVSASRAVSSSFATTSSFAQTASFTLNALVTASVSSNTITFTKGNGTTFPITVNTGSGGGGATPPGGSTTQIQYNNAGAFDGVSTLTFDGYHLTATGYFIPQNALGGLSNQYADYTIYEAGVYRFTTADPSQVIILPNPAGKDSGQTLIIINADTGNHTNYNNIYRPQDPDGTPIYIIQSGSADTLVNIDGIWVRTAKRP